MQIINISGSKSITNRALILASLCKTEVKINNSAICDDTKYMIQGLKNLGIKIKQKKTSIIVQGNGGKFKKTNKTIKIFTGNAGTTTRFLTALSTLTGNKIIIDGNKRMKNRPIKELVKALNLLGAKIKSNNGYPPLTIFNKKLHGGKISINGNISSQYLSAILMTVPFAEKNTTINAEQNLCSKPYINMTIKIAKQFNIDIVNKKYRQFSIKPIQLNLKNKLTYNIESDASSASYIGAYIALNPNKKIILKNIFKNSLQGDIKFLDYLEKMGCKTKKVKEGTLIYNNLKSQKSQRTIFNTFENFSLKSLKKIDMNKTPDLVMTFAVLSMFAEGKTKIYNIKNLKIKETDRIKALKNEIKKFGIKIKTGEDYIEIEGNPNKIFKLKNKKITIKTYNDHRIAMSFGILKTILPNITIENKSCVNKSFPTFWKTLDKLNKF